MMRLSYSAAVLGSVLAAGLGVAGPARAEQMVANYTTWLRAGPSEQFAVIDEIAGGNTVEVDGCNGGWCKVISVRAPGYMLQALLAGSQRPQGVPKPGGSCVPGQHFTPEGPLPLRLCEAVP